MLYYELCSKLLSKNIYIYMRWRNAMRLCFEHKWHPANTKKKKNCHSLNIENFYGKCLLHCLCSLYRYEKRALHTGKFRWCAHFLWPSKKKNVLFYATAGRAFTMWCMVWSWCWLFFIQPYLAFVCWRRRLSRFVPYLAKSPHLHH